MKEIERIYRYVVDSGNAGKIYEVLKSSCLSENNGTMQPCEGCVAYVEFSYEDGILRVEEKTTTSFSYMGEVLYFFADPDHIHSTEEYTEEEPIQGVARLSDEDLPF